MNNSTLMSIKEILPWPVSQKEWNFFIIGITTLRHMLARSSNELLLEESLINQKVIFEMFIDGRVSKLGQRVYIESRFNQLKSFKQDLSENLNYIESHQLVDLQELLIEADNLRRLIDIVHEDAPLVLGYLRGLHLTAKDVEGLRQAMPFKYALTSVLRVLGSPPPKGYQSLVIKLIDAKALDQLLSLIICLIQVRYRYAPQEIYSVLGILEQDDDVVNWDRSQWFEFKKSIQNFYKLGFAILTKELFRRFIAIQHDLDRIEQLKIELNQSQYQDIAWGNYPIMTSSIMDDLTLMASFITIKDRTLMDYSEMAVRLRRILDKRNREGWTQEVDIGLRQLFTVMLPRVSVVYRGADSEHRKSLNDKLSFLAREDGERPSLQEVFNRILKNQELRLMDLAVLIEMIFQSTGVQRDDLVAIPKEDESIYHWLQRWNGLLGEAWNRLIKERNFLVKVNKDVEEAYFYSPGNVCGSRVSPAANLKDQTISAQLLNLLKKVFLGIIDEIGQELILYVLRRDSTRQCLYISFFDDFLHLMGCMGTGVCVWNVRDQQVADQCYHFGTIVLKDKRGRLISKAQVHLLKIGIQGLAEKRSGIGWKVLFLDNNNFLRQEMGIDYREAHTALLAFAQFLAEKNGLQGAVLAEHPEIHAQEDREREYVKKLVEQGWLVKTELSENIILALDANGEIRYQCQQVYWIQIPTGKYHFHEANLENDLKLK